ncbi:MAG: restriction system-associated AAA family ATPase [Bacteroidota bacterium]
MRIVSVKILGDNFRSLKANKLYEFYNSESTERLAPKVFAGLNGSGKSNFLELFSEIFYYLELYHFPSASEEDREGAGFGFEIQYILPLMDIIAGGYTGQESVLVNINKPLNEHPEFAFRNLDADSFSRVDYTGFNGETLNLLPKRMIAYTSGQNELLSNPYYKIRYHYFKSLEDDTSAPEKSIIDKNRLFFLDYDSNFSIFIANMLMAEIHNLEYLKKVLAVKELESFRITLNLQNYKKNYIKLNYRLNKELERLKFCATTWFEDKNEDLETKQIILDYKVNEATKAAFKFHFKNPFELFKTFYELDTLNLHLVPVRTRQLILNAHKSLNLSDEMPKPDPSNLVFRIEKIIVDKIIDEENSTRKIYYKALSDGEHQFSQVIGSVLMMEEAGCLFLFDEPNTHFNPKWRAKMISILNRITADSFDYQNQVKKVRQQEIIITTHSPFIISDSIKENVYKFENGAFTKPKYQTYGSSINFLLESIFDRDISISDFSNNELNKLKDGIRTRVDLQYAKEELLNFGESIEKFDAYSFLLEKEKELDELDEEDEEDDEDEDEIDGYDSFGDDDLQLQ